MSYKSALNRYAVKVVSKITDARDTFFDEGASDDEMGSRKISSLSLGDVVSFKSEMDKWYVVSATIEEDPDPDTPSFFMLSTGNETLWLSFGTGDPEKITIWDYHQKDDVQTGEKVEYDDAIHGLSSMGTTRYYPKRTPAHFEEDHRTVIKHLHYWIYTRDGRTSLVVLKSDEIFGVLTRAREISKHAINYYIE